MTAKPLDGAMLESFWQKASRDDWHLTLVASDVESALRESIGALDEADAEQEVWMVCLPSKEQRGEGWKEHRRVARLVRAALKNSRAALSGAGEDIVERARAEEREACAKLADNWDTIQSPDLQAMGVDIAAAIRERGKR